MTEQGPGLGPIVACLPEKDLGLRAFLPCHRPGEEAQIQFVQGIVMRLNLSGDNGRLVDKK